MLQGQQIQHHDENAHMTAILEIPLSAETKIANIEATEAAKHQLLASPGNSSGRCACLPKCRVLPHKHVVLKPGLSCVALSSEAKALALLQHQGLMSLHRRHEPAATHSSVLTAPGMQASRRVTTAASAQGAAEGHISARLWARDGQGPGQAGSCSQVRAPAGVKHSQRVLALCPVCLAGHSLAALDGSHLPLQQALRVAALSA